jgi:energy-coupling factor transport system substrate-specific component
VSTPSTEARTTRRVPAIRLRPRAALLLAVTSAFGVVAFTWPLLLHQHAGANTAHSADAPWIFVALVPLLLAIVMAEIAEGSLDAKAVALLGILAACIAGLRIPTPGIDGFEPMWFLLILSARVFGRGFGFVLGATAFFASALITGGVGPWLPFQMFAAAWVGFGAGCLPAASGRLEQLLLAAYSAVAALVYGAILNFWFWPFVGTTTSVSFMPGAGVGTNLHRFFIFDITTSLGWDFTRAATSVVLIAVLGRPVLRALRRATTRAVFEPQVSFTPADPAPAQDPATGDPHPAVHP